MMQLVNETKQTLTFEEWYTTLQNQSQKLGQSVNDTEYWRNEYAQGKTVTETLRQHFSGVMILE